MWEWFKLQSQNRLENYKITRLLGIKWSYSVSQQPNLTVLSFASSANFPFHRIYPALYWVFTCFFFLFLLVQSEIQFLVKASSYLFLKSTLGKLMLHARDWFSGQVGSVSALRPGYGDKWPSDAWMSAVEPHEFWTHALELCPEGCLRWLQKCQRLSFILYWQYSITVQY